MEGRRSHLTPMPDNYISLRHLQEKRLKEKEEEERRRRLIEQEEEERRRRPIEQEEERRRRLIEQEEEERRRRLIEQEEEERKKLAVAVEALVLGGSGDRRQGGEDRTICREVRVSEGEEKRGGGEERVPAVATARKMGWKKKHMGKKKREGAVALVVAGDGETAAIGPCTADSAVPGWKTKAGSGDTARLAAAAAAAAAELKIGGSGEGEDTGVVVGKGGEGRKEAKGKRWGQQAKSTAAVVVGENSGGRGWAEKGEEIRSEAMGKGRGQPAKLPAAIVGEEGGQSEWAEKGEEGRSEAKRQGRGRPAKSPAATMEAAPAVTMVTMPVATTAAATATVGERGGRRGWAKKRGGLLPRRGDDVGQMWVPKCGGTENC